MDMFPAEFVDALLRKEGGSRESVPGLLALYNLERERVPGAPLIADLKPEHTAAVVGIRTFNLDSDFTFDGIVKRLGEFDQFLNESNNPYFPRFLGKTEDKPSVWVQDTGDLEEVNITRIMQLFYLWARPIGGDGAATLSPAPTANKEVLATIIDALKHNVATLLRPMGNTTGKNEEFRWGSTLPMLASFGYVGFRELCKYIAEYSDEEDFQAWSEADDKSITANLLQAAELTGYPINLGHIDCTDMIDELERCKLLQAPRWLPGLVLIHVLKHTRYYRSLNGEPYLFVAYRGRHSFIQLNQDGLNTIFGATVNQSAMATLMSILRLSRGGKKKTPCEIAVTGMVNNLIPCHMTQPIPAHDRPDIIMAPGISISQAIPNQHERKRCWIDPGITIRNVGIFDAKTGKINKKGSVSGELAVSLQWPLIQIENGDLARWLCELPSEVYPTLPNELIFGWIKNVNHLGHPRGLVHIYNGLILANILRPMLHGTDIGSTLDIEYPPVWVLPMGSTRKSTTNQGKTNFCRVTANILAPGISTSSCTGSTSPPSQRAAASSIEIYGTAIYDEFIMPTSPDHFLHFSSFVSLCTGSKGNTGRAMENSPGFRLKFPLFLAAKSGPDQEDVVNRSFFIFLDSLNLENKCSDEQLSKVMSGSAATMVRLSLLLWIYKNDIVAKVRKLSIVQSKWRFNATLAIIKMLAGDEFEDVEKYLEASWRECDRQRQEVVSSNLLGEMGYTEKFNPEWYFMTCKDDVLAGLAYKSQSKGSIRLLDVLRELVEDGGNRTFSNELTKKKVQENGASSIFGLQLQQNECKGFERDGYKLVVADKVKTDHRTWTTGVKIIKLNLPEPVVFKNPNA